MNVPEIYCPLPVASSPHAEAAEAFVADWAERFRLVETGLALVENRVGHLSAYVHPGAPAEVVKIGAAWTTWLFAYDDHLVENAARGDLGHARAVARTQGQILAALGAVPPGSTPKPGGIAGALTAAVLDITSAVRRLRPDWDRAGFVNDLRRFFQANLWEIGNTVRGRRPRLGAYLTMRRPTSAFLPSYRISAAMTGVRLPTDLWHHVAVEQLERMACDYGSWLNDLYSYEREEAEGCVHSLIPILCQEHGCAPQAAAERVADMCRIEIQSYLELKSSLPDLGLALTGELDRYLQLLEHWMSGSLAWYRMSPRYRVLEKR